MSEFLEVFGDMLGSLATAQPITNNGKGGAVPAGDPVTFPVRFSGGTRMVRDIAGREVVSSGSIIAQPDLGLTADRHLYSVDGGAFQRALRLDVHTDEAGPYYVKIYFP